MIKQIFILAISLLSVFTISAQVPKKAKDAYTQAMGLVAQNRLAESLPFFKKATDAYPAYYDAYLQAAIICGKLSIHNDAKFCFEKAIKLKPDLCPAYISYGVYYKDTRGKTDSALMFLEKAAKLKCDTSMALNYSLAWCYNEKGNFDKALLYLKRILSIDSVNRNAINEVSFTFRKLDKVTEGSEYFQALYNKTKLDLYMYYIGLFAIHIKDKDKALVAYEELNKIASKLATALDKKIKAMEQQ